MQRNYPRFRLFIFIRRSVLFTKSPLTEFFQAIIEVIGNYFYVVLILIIPLRRNRIYTSISELPWYAKNCVLMGTLHNTTEQHIFSMCVCKIGPWQHTIEPHMHVNLLKISHDAVILLAELRILHLWQQNMLQKSNHLFIYFVALALMTHRVINILCWYSNLYLYTVWLALLVYIPQYKAYIK